MYWLLSPNNQNVYFISVVPSPGGTHFSRLCGLTMLLCYIIIYFHFDSEMCEVCQFVLPPLHGQWQQEILPACFLAFLLAPCLPACLFICLFCLFSLCSTCLISSFIHSWSSESFFNIACFVCSWANYFSTKLEELQYLGFGLTLELKILSSKWRNKHIWEVLTFVLYVAEQISFPLN